MQTCVQLGNLFKPTVTLNSHQFWRIGLTYEKRKDALFEHFRCSP